MGDKSVKDPEVFERVGRAQARRVQERPAEAPFGMQLSNEDLLKLSKAAAKNLIAAARLRGEQNISAEEAWDSAAETLNNEELMRIGVNEQGESIFKDKETRDAALAADRMSLNTEAFPDGGFKTSPGDKGKFPKFNVPVGAPDPEGDGTYSYITPESRKGTMNRDDI